MEKDPYRKAGLFGTVSVYRYPYNMGGEFNWHLSTFPYLALCMDKKGKSKAKLREENHDEHLKYYEKTRSDMADRKWLRGVAWVAELRDRVLYMLRGGCGSWLWEDRYEVLQNTSSFTRNMRCTCLFFGALAKGSQTLLRWK